MDPGGRVPPRHERKIASDNCQSPESPAGLASPSRRTPPCGMESWTAAAQRSSDAALETPTTYRTQKVSGTPKSGVALVPPVGGTHLPPQSKMPFSQGGSNRSKSSQTPVKPAKNRQSLLRRKELRSFCVNLVKPGQTQSNHFDCARPKPIQSFPFVETRALRMVRASSYRTNFRPRIPLSSANLRRRGFGERRFFMPNSRSNPRRMGAQIPRLAAHSFKPIQGKSSQFKPLNIFLKTLIPKINPCANSLLK